MEQIKMNVWAESARAGIFAIGKRRPGVFKAFLQLAHEVMHPASGFSPLTRELLGAYVSKKFDCSFCHLGHLETAVAIGGEEVRLLVDEPTQELTVLFELADKIVENRVTETDLQEFVAKGFTEKQYEDVVFVCALFGFANRMVTGFGIEYNAARDEASSRQLAKGYVFH